MSSTPAAGPQAPAAPPNTVRCTIDGKPYTFPRGTLIVDAVQQVGRPIPYYCYHPRLQPVGACRVCMVQVEGAPVAARGPIVTTGCTTPVFDDLKIETMSDPAKLARKQVLEFLLINHPLDCPICDKGGECDLQDFTLTYGPGKSQFAEQKILRHKAEDLGPFLVLDQERCILCQRCVRYEQEVLHEQNIVLKERGDRTVIETGGGEPYGGYFSGNNTELCPVGALTSHTYRFKARPWDLRPIPSVCQGCSLGCNVTVNLRDKKIVRLLWRENPGIDAGWLCDRGRYGFGHTEAGERLATPLVRRDGRLQAATWEEALRAAASGLTAGPAAVLGGGRLNDEEGLALSQLARVGMHTNDVDWRVGYQGFAAPEAIGLASATVADLDRADLVLLVNTCPLEEAPVLDIRLRRAARRTTVIDLGPVRNLYHAPSRRVACAPTELAQGVAGLAAEFAAAKSPLVIWNGRGGAVLAEAVAALGAPLLVPGEFSNARGAEAAGLVPDLLPGYHAVGAGAEVAAVWGAELPQAPGRDASGILAAAAAGDLHALYVVGANPLRSFPDGGLADRALDAVPFLVVQDLFLTETAQRADVVLPALGALEKAGHSTNLAGERQPVARTVAGPAGALADGTILLRLATALRVTLADQAPPVAAVPARVRLPAWEPEGRGDEAAAGSDQGLGLLLRPRLFSGGGSAAFDPNLQPVHVAGEVRLHPEAAAGLGLEDGAAVHLHGAGATVRGTVRLDTDLLVGWVALAAHDFGGNRLGPRVRITAVPAAAGVAAR